MAQNKNYSEENTEYPSPTGTDNPELESLLYARHVEVESFKDLQPQRGTQIPALFNQFYKFVQNPSTVSVETFKRMVDTDDTVGSGMDFLTTCLAARLGRYQHPNKEIADWVNLRLEEIDGGFFNVLKEMLSASWAGFSVAEKVWANTDNGFVPKKIVTLPPQSILFETERTGELTEDGILQYQRNYNPAFAAAGTNYLFGFSSFLGGGGDKPMRPDPFAKLGDFPYPLRTANMYSYLSIRIPKIKCLHYSFDAQGKFGNPYGRSLLRRCYKYYVTKDALLQMLAIALDRKGTPLQVIFADHNTTLVDANKYNGTNSRGQRVGIRADEAARDAFRNIHNDTTIILPGKRGQVFDIETIQQSSNSGDFIDALKFCNASIMRALLIPALVFNGGDGTGSYALGQEHSKTFDKILDGMNAGLRQTIIQQLVKEMIAYNFPESAWKKDGLGDFGKRELSQEEIDKEMEVIEKAVNIGAIDMADLQDLNQIREKINFEPRKTVIEPPMQMGPDGMPLDPNAEPAEPGAEGEPPAGKEPGKEPKPAKEKGKGLARLAALWSKK